MDAVTYPDDKVAGFLLEHFIPLRVRFDAKPLAVEFGIRWTPNLITLDSEGKDHYGVLGYVSPQEFIPTFLVGLSVGQFDLNKFDEAIANLDRLLSDYPKSFAAPEAMYYRAVSLFKKTHEGGHLKTVYAELQKMYPTSKWAERAYPYSRL